MAWNQQHRQLDHVLAGNVTAIPGADMTCSSVLFQELNALCETFIGSGIYLYLVKNSDGNIGPLLLERGTQERPLAVPVVAYAEGASTTASGASKEVDLLTSAFQVLAYPHALWVLTQQATPITFAVCIDQLSAALLAMGKCREIHSRWATQRLPTVVSWASDSVMKKCFTTVLDNQARESIKWINSLSEELRTQVQLTDELSRSLQCRMSVRQAPSLGSLSCFIDICSVIESSTSTFVPLCFIDFFKCHQIARSLDHYILDH